MRNIQLIFCQLSLTGTKSRFVTSYSRSKSILATFRPDLSGAASFVSKRVSLRLNSRSMSGNVENVESVSSGRTLNGRFRHENEFLRLDDPITGERPTIDRLHSCYALVMLNSETMDVNLVRRIWQFCDFKICADGGANRLFDGLSSSQFPNYIPDAIKGDLDSLRSDVKEFYR
jgi:Thiamin pyrophosphokinase, catalytic domain